MRLAIIGAAIACAAILSGCTGSSAQTSAPTATVTVTFPTTNTDGSAFNPTTDQKQTTIQYGTSKGGPYPNQYILAGTTASGTITLPASPTCGATYYFVAETVSNAGMISAPSVEASKALPACPPPTPNPPTNLTAT